MQLSGIYKITCLPTNKIYIGSAVNLMQRKYNHFKRLADNTHTNIHLQRAFVKYGKKQFLFEVIERCEVEKLIEREQYYLDTLLPDFNICRIAGSALGRKQRPETIVKRVAKTKGQKRTVEQIKRIKDSTNKPEVKAKWKESSSKTFQSEEFRAKRKQQASLRKKNNKGQWC